MSSKKKSSVGGTVKKRFIPYETNEDTAKHIHSYADEEPNHGALSWPTDACSSKQHMNFVLWRNQMWSGADSETHNMSWKEFLHDYADRLERGEFGDLSGAMV